jgi:DNA-directed RNA polymerase subunit alpha
MNRHFSVVAEQQRFEEEEETKETETEKKQTIDLNKPLSELKLNTRILNGLTSAKIETLKDLLSAPREKLEEIKNLGKKSISELEGILKEMGLQLKTKAELEKQKVEK